MQVQHKVQLDVRDNGLGPGNASSPTTPALGLPYGTAPPTYGVIQPVAPQPQAMKM
jgi:hypothetical protein